MSCKLASSLTKKQEQILITTIVYKAVTAAAVKTMMWRKESSIAKKNRVKKLESIYSTIEESTYFYSRGMQCEENIFMHQDKKIQMSERTETKHKTALRKKYESIVCNKRIVLRQDEVAN